MSIQSEYEEAFRIRHSEADRHGRLKLRTLADYMQEAAARHADILGVGVNYLRMNNRLWVLSRFKIKITEYPQIGDTVTIRTFPTTFDRLFAHRQFEVKNDRGEIMSTATSYWLLLDAATLRPISPMTVADKFPDNRHLPEFFHDLAKIVRREVKHCKQYQVSFSAVDVNDHLNNAEYFGKIQDFLSGKGEIRELQVNFIAEAKENAEISIGGELNNDSFYIEGTSPVAELYFQSYGKISNITTE